MKRIPRLLAVALAVAGLLAVSTANAAVAAPGHPGKPSAGHTFFTEDFSNTPSGTPVNLAAYTGKSGISYTADPEWLGWCNGSVYAANSPDGDWTFANGCDEVTYSLTREMDWALGVHAGAALPFSNKALGEFTGNDPGGHVQLESTTSIVLPAANRFIAGYFDAAAEFCYAQHPTLQLALIDGPTTLPLGSAVDTCTDPRGTTITAADLDNATGTDIRVGTYSSGTAVIVPSAAVGIQLNNLESSGSGNDGATDNIRLVDVTPQLDQSFVPAVVGPGAASTLTLTVTNTKEKFAKAGFSGQAHLPAGVSITNNSVYHSTCANAQLAASPTSPDIVIAGDLSAGAAACTFTFSVTAAGTGEFRMAGSTASNLIGLRAPGTAVLRVELPATGVDIVRPLLIAGVAVVLGIGLLVLAYRRRVRH
jgi:LPXTG-motif cell wall-anchored protein